MLLPVLVCVTIVAAKAKEAIGQVDLNKIQEMKEMADSFTKTEEDKKDE